MDTVLNAVVWSVGITLLSQGISIAVMAILGLPPKRLAHVIEDEQNTAVGGFFFIIATITSIYAGLAGSDGHDPAESTAADLAWVFGGAFLALIMTFIAFWAAHILLKPIEGESVYGYIRREVIDEQNAALAFFLGGLAIAPFVATINQIL